MRPRSRTILPYAECGEITPPWRRMRWVVAAIAVAWALYATGFVVINHLNLSRWGSNPDIAESPAIYSYRSRYMLPFIALAVAMDVIAAWIALTVCVGNHRKVRALCVLAACAVSLLWHGLVLAIATFFALV